ncbi:hypothetical protein [Clostridium paraputrificum]|uniref:hypothetical protein n=1 Tax=Clostridium paraputrificum TaxID=29363 RepID=UPI00189F493C|nr:hypothetical protein [Clostridium paraputrificum]
MAKNIQELIDYLETVKNVRGESLKVFIDGEPVEDFFDSIWTDESHIDFLTDGKTY